MLVCISCVLSHMFRFSILCTLQKNDFDKYFTAATIQQLFGYGGRPLRLWPLGRKDSWSGQWSIIREAVASQVTMMVLNPISSQVSPPRISTVRPHTVSHAAFPGSLALDEPRGWQILSLDGQTGNQRGPLGGFAAALVPGDVAPEHH